MSISAKGNLFEVFFIMNLISLANYKIKINLSKPIPNGHGKNKK